MKVMGKYFVMIGILLSTSTIVISKRITSNRNHNNVQEGQSLSVSITGRSTYFQQGSPTLTSINPDNAQRGESLSVSITGQNTRFLQGSGTLGVWFAQGSPTINASSYWASSDTLLSADFDIPADAPLGLWDLNVWTGLDGLLILFDGFLIGELVDVDVEIEPETLNLSSKGNWITCYLWFPEVYYAYNVDIDTILLNGEVGPVWYCTEDEENAKQMLMVKFSRREVQEILDWGEVELTVSGELFDGTRFEGTDVIRVMNR